MFASTYPTLYLVALFTLTVSSFELPDDVFQPGEVRPSRPVKTKKKVVKKSAEAAGQKRNISELDVSQRKKARRT
jgi:poly(A) polymerase